MWGGLFAGLSSQWNTGNSWLSWPSWCFNWDKSPLAEYYPNIEDLGCRVGGPQLWICSVRVIVFLRMVHDMIFLFTRTFQLQLSKGVGLFWCWYCIWLFSRKLRALISWCPQCCPLHLLNLMICWAASEDTLRSYCRTWSARLSTGTPPKVWFISQVGELVVVDHRRFTIRYSQFLECQKGLGSAATKPKQKWGGDIWIYLGYLNGQMINQATICFGWKESPTCWKYSRSQPEVHVLPDPICLDVRNPAGFFSRFLTWDLTGFLTKENHRLRTWNNKKDGLESVLPIIGRSMDCLWATSFRGQVFFGIDHRRWLRNFLKPGNVTVTKIRIYIYI